MPKGQPSLGTLAKYTDSVEPPFICRDCGFSGKSGTSMVIHHRISHSPSPIKRRGKYKKRVKIEAQVEPPQSRPVTKNPVNFCPNCGCNLADVQVAINLRDDAS